MEAQLDYQYWVSRRKRPSNRSYALRRSLCAREVTFRKDRKKIKATFGGHLPLGRCIASQGKFAVVVDVREAVYKMSRPGIQMKHQVFRSHSDVEERLHQ